MNTEQIQQEAEFIRDPTEKGNLYMYGFKDGYNACQSRHAWVKVSERLPTKEDANKLGKVLLHRETNPDQQGMAITIYDWYMVKYCDDKTSWMHLPEPPLDNNFPKTESNEIENL